MELKNQLILNRLICLYSVDMSSLQPLFSCAHPPSECARSHKYLASPLPVLRLDLRFSECCCSQAWFRHRWEFPRTVRFSGLAAMPGRKAPARHHGASRRNNKRLFSAQLRYGVPYGITRDGLQSASFPFINAVLQALQNPDKSS